jgi:hypothetical protein
MLDRNDPALTGVRKSLKPNPSDIIHREDRDAVVVAETIHAGQESDTVTAVLPAVIPVSDTIPDHSQLPAGTSSPDSTGSVTAGAPNGETGETPQEQPGEASTDTLQITVPIAGPRAAPEAIWDRIDSRNREIQAERTESPPAPRQQAPVYQQPDIPVAGVPTFIYDASYYLDSVTGITFFREHILPVQESGSR